MKIFIKKVIIIYLLFSMGCSEKTVRRLTIFHAGSLSKPLEKVEKEFEKEYSIDVVREASGSQRCARKITELKKPCDIMMSSDYNIIDELLIPEYADFNILFASNQMVLAYTEKSKYADDINSNNWYKILVRKDVIWGHSDPNIDPCGYRALMVIKLAEIFYKQPGLYKKLINNRAIGNIRPKSIELVSLLQTSNMDYAWEYRSVAVQYGLKFIELPEKINLSNPKYEGFYKKVSVKLSRKSLKGEKTIEGKSITYGLTLIKNAPNEKEALLFLQYFLNPKKGLKILEKMGQKPYIPALLKSENMLNKIPNQLKTFVKLKKS